MTRMLRKQNGRQALGLVTLLALAGASVAQSGPVPPPPPAGKDIVLDRPVPVPVPAVAVAQASSAITIAGLGLDMLRQQSVAAGDAQANVVVSPLSLVAALGMVHAGSAGQGAKELAGLAGPGPNGARFFTTRLPSLMASLTKPGGAAQPFRMANRVWVDHAAAAAIPPAYASALARRYQASASRVSFQNAGAARTAINGWVAKATANQIAELMPEGSVKPTTKIVLTNALHFKSLWEEPFDPAMTAPKPFNRGPGTAAHMVPTMSDTRDVRRATIDNLTLMELPFAGGAYTLLIVMAPAGHTLNALETDLQAGQLAGWSARLAPQRCQLQLPKFRIAAAGKSLKAGLEAAGVKTVFGPSANFTPMLGKAAAGTYLDDVFQSAAISVDEHGGEASAATGATVAAKSFSVPPPVCAVDRAFMFAVMHAPTQTPLFVGKVSDPALP